MCNGCWVESILRPGVLKRTLSHKWLRWYLPTFLFTDGLFTLMYIASFIVLAIPIEPVLKIIKSLLEKDEKLQDRIVLSVQHIVDLLGFCLNNTRFSFQNEFYEQVEGAAMGSPVSLIVANLYIEHFEREAWWSASNPPRYWYRFVADTWVIQKVPINRDFWSTSIALIQQSSLL